MADSPRWVGDWSERGTIALRLCVVLLLGACADTAEGPELPAGWSGAERIGALTQSECDGSPLDGAEETVEAQVSGGAIQLAYRHAHFRCQQVVEGFLRRGEGLLDVLVQPVDMNPDSVARCDCRYDLALELEASPGEYELTVYRRWDNLNDPNEPVQVGRVSVGRAVCEPGADQTCNDNPALSSLRGTCQPDATCSCSDGVAKSPETGRCR